MSSDRVERNSSSTGQAPVSAYKLAQLQTKFAASLNPLELWPASLFETLYSSRTWLGVTFHNLRNPVHIKGVLVDHSHAFDKAPLNQLLMQPILGQGLITAQGEQWAAQRKIVAPAFRRNLTNRLVPFISATAENCAEQFIATDTATIEIFPRMAEATFAIVARLLFGEFENPIPQSRTAQDLATFYNGVASPDAPDVRAAIESLRASCLHAVRQHRRGGNDTLALLDFLLGSDSAPDEALLTDTELRDNIITFLLAGHETTAAALTWTLYLLAKFPNAQQRVADEVVGACGDGVVGLMELEKLTFLRLAVTESLRLYPPVASISRIATCDVDVDDIHFHKGDVADILIYPMHRNCQLWQNPDVFDPDRFSAERSEGRHKFSHLPFGAGPRVCIGSQVAILEITIIVAALIRKYHFGTSVGYSPKPKVNITLRPSDGMPLHVSRR